MPIRVTRKELMAMRPCNGEARLALFGRRNSLTAKQAIKAGAYIPDLLWVAGELGRKDLCVRFALACAQRVAHLNPDPRIQAALDATANWLANPSEENAKAANDAAWDAAGAEGAARWMGPDAIMSAGAAAWTAWTAFAASGPSAARAASAAWSRASARRDPLNAIFLEIFGDA